jgi:hypothetical protein
MNKKALILSMIIVTLLLTSFVATAAACAPRHASAYENISVNTVKNMVLGRYHQNLVIIDLRPTSLFKNGHVPGAINVPVLPPPADWSVLQELVFHRNDTKHPTSTH